MPREIGAVQKLFREYAASSNTDLLSELRSRKSQAYRVNIQLQKADYRLRAEMWKQSVVSHCAPSKSMPVK